jgi:hypothetical protein
VKGKKHMTKTHSLTTLLRLVFVVPTAHAAEPSAAPNPAGSRGEREKTNTFGQCVSMTAEKLAAAMAAAAARPSLSTRWNRDLARGGSAFGSPGRWMSDKGRLLQP